MFNIFEDNNSCYANNHNQHINRPTEEIFDKCQTLAPKNEVGIVTTALWMASLTTQFSGTQ